MGSKVGSDYVNQIFLPFTSSWMSTPGGRFWYDTIGLYEFYGGPVGHNLGGVLHNGCGAVSYTNDGISP